MEQDIKEIEFLTPKKLIECPDCQRKFVHLWFCKDKVMRCQRCKNKLVTNKFYNPAWKQKQYIGNFNMSSQEREIMIKKYIDKGHSLAEANKQVNYDISKMQENKKRKFFREKEINTNLQIQKSKSNEQKRNLLMGLGMKVK